MSADKKPRTTLPQPFEIHQNAREEWTILFGTSLRTEDEWGGTMVADIYAVDCSFRTIYSRPTFESGKGRGDELVRRRPLDHWRCPLILVNGAEGHWMVGFPFLLCGLNHVPSF
ncbi:hypothetical protein TNCV_813931 [Trichonephila clavipes]|nr:hypothetical protein TNCV_813931 [Trichonephila clavipes]